MRADPPLECVLLRFALTEGQDYLLLQSAPPIYIKYTNIKIPVPSAQIPRSKKQSFDPAYGPFLYPMGIYDDIHYIFLDRSPKAALGLLSKRSNHGRAGLRR